MSSASKTPDRHRTVLETSVLLLTLTFIALQIWSLKGPASMTPDELKFYSTLVQLFFAVGFLLISAALVATLLIFDAFKPQYVEGAEAAEVVFFVLALIMLALFFFVNALSAYYALFAVAFSVSAAAFVAEHKRIKAAIQRVAKKYKISLE
jgi:cytochrome b561